MIKNIDAEINFPQTGNIDQWRNTADITRLKGAYARFGNVVIIEGAWSGSASNTTVIFTVPPELCPKSTLASRGSGTIYNSGLLKAEYTLNTDGTFKQAEFAGACTSGSFTIVYSLA